MMDVALRIAGCPSAERKVRTTPTGGAAPGFALQGVESPFAQSRQPGRAVFLKRRRKERDDFLGREGKPLQSLLRKAQRQTLNSCLVQPARGVDASSGKIRLHPLAERQAKRAGKKLDYSVPFRGAPS